MKKSPQLNEMAYKIAVKNCVIPITQRRIQKYII